MDSCGVDMKEPPKVGHYSRTLNGHRAAYVRFAIEKLGGNRISTRELLTHKGAALFLMIEDNFGLYVLSCLLRAALGRRTVGLLFRPGPAINGPSLRLRTKRAMLRILRHVPTVQTLSIVPTPLIPQIGAIVDGWIHDFQLWDLSDADRHRIAWIRESGRSSDPAATSLLETIRSYSSGRPLLVALGAQNRSKGIDLLVSFMRTAGTSGWAVLVAGRFDEASISARADIQSMGGMVVDRYLSDAEIEAAYSVATAVWCMYDPAYDQASGILGRAVQLGVPVLVRRGSVSESLCIQLSFPHVAADIEGDLASALVKLPPLAATAAKPLATLDIENAKKLHAALGLPAQAGPQG